LRRIRMKRWTRLLLLALATGAAAAEDKLPDGPGLAAKYPQDRGIAKDAAVLFADDFESGDLSKWDDRSGTISVTGDAKGGKDEPPHAGRHCAAAPMHRGKDHGGEAKKWFLPGADTVYARCYVRFSPDYQYAHHFLTLLATQKGNRWSAFGKAGQKPDGTWFCSGMEPWFAWGENPPPGELNLYTYSMDMEIDRKMNKYWGNGFFPPGPEKGKAAGPARVIPALDKWQCWEFMIQANSAEDKADGRQAMWLDGKKVAEFTGIRWRKGPELKVNCFWLQHFGYDDSDPTSAGKKGKQDEQTAWFDDVVIARKYVGPMGGGG
jgi:hypothetical protein